MLLPTLFNLDETFSVKASIAFDVHMADFSLNLL